MNGVDAALLLRNDAATWTKLSSMQRRDLVELLRRHVVHHELVAFSAEYHLSITQPLRTEYLVHIVQADRVFLKEVVRQYMPGAVFLIDLPYFTRVRFAGAHIIHKVERSSQELFALGHGFRLVVARLVTDEVVRLVRLPISLVS